MTATEDDEGDLILDTLWGRVLEAWTDDKTHAALLDYAIRAEKLPVIAGRYRALKDDAEKAPVAKKKLDGIVLAATEMMLSMKTPPRTKAPLWLTVSVAVACALVIGWVLFRAMSGLLRHG